VGVIVEGSVYKMWYGGCTGSLCAIGYATSIDGLTWTKYAGNPVLQPEPSGWDQTLGNPTVIKTGGIYGMWYAGNGPGGIRIGYATSTDGVSWTKSPSNPVLGPDPNSTWESYTISTPVVLWDGTSYTMWYSGASGGLVYAMGRATSTDGVTWTRDPANPLLSPQVPWEGDRIHPLEVLITASGYELYYYGNLQYSQTGHAISPDGRFWTRDPLNPILSPGSPGSWDAASLGDVAVVNLGSERKMWYTATDGSVRRVGLAIQTTPALGVMLPEFLSSPVVLLSLMAAAQIGAVAFVVFLTRSRRGPL